MRIRHAQDSVVAEHHDDVEDGTDGDGGDVNADRVSTPEAPTGGRKDDSNDDAKYRAEDLPGV